MLPPACTAFTPNRPRERKHMKSWIEDLAARLDSGQPAVLVTVAAARGSTPRAPGAHMVVGPRDSAGSIGGGQLELRAIELARTMIADGATRPCVQRFPLGASVGQCCGGVMELAFEPIGADAGEWVRVALTHAGAHRPWGRVVAIGATPAPTRVFDAHLHALHADAGYDADSVRVLAERAATLLAGHADGALLANTRPGGDADWLLDASVPPELQVVLFGAGHVGCAVARVLARLPLRLTWVDSRDDAFPAGPAAGFMSRIDCRSTDTPLAEVSDAPSDAVFLVMTHSHALDFDLVRAILDRGDARLCGMIGSNAKHENFARRLRARGCSEAAIARLHCPIGAPGINGKEPEVIAIAVAAELLQLRGTRFDARPAQRRTDGTHAPQTLEGPRP
ncbi:putative xanthine dehydrogenase [Thauera sp. 63]|nr:putative xanthine dehydrogenase [Thauera sp. 63]